MSFLGRDGVAGDSEVELRVEMLHMEPTSCLDAPAEDIAKTDAFEERNNVALDRIVDGLKQGKFKRVVILSGAGISVAAGIPDFRSPGTGLYDNLQKYELPTPQSVFDINYFAIRPEPFFQLAKELFPGRIRPTLSHYFIKLLHDKDVLLRNYTQNIDTLERQAGIDPEVLVEAHGSFARAHCTICATEFHPDHVREVIFENKIPKCSCGGVVKPDIIFFGERLPNRFFQLYRRDLAQCDLLVVMGTSLKVQPFASLITLVNPKIPRLLINREEVGTEKQGVVGGFVFNSESTRDVKLLGNCEDCIRLLLDKLQWIHDMRGLIDKYECDVLAGEYSAHTALARCVAQSGSGGVEMKCGESSEGRRSVSKVEEIARVFLLLNPVSLVPFLHKLALEHDMKQRIKGIAANIRTLPVKKRFSSKAVRMLRPKLLPAPHAKRHYLVS